MSLFQKSTVKRRTTVARVRNSGEWTEARFTSFVKGSLRGAMWPPKFKSIEKAFIGHGINPATNRRCKMYRCACCGQDFPQKQIKADHIVPVVGPEGFIDWNTFVARLYVEVQGFQAVCEGCHKEKTNAERNARKLQKQNEN